MTMKNKLGAIFDLDGTLLDSMNVWKEVDKVFLSRRGIVIPDDYTQAIKALGFEQAAKYTIQRFQLKETTEEVIAEWSELAGEEYKENVSLKPNAQEYLNMLKENGVKLAVATALHPHLCELTLKNNGIYNYFDAFTFSEEVKRGKEYPDIYLLAAEKLGLSPSDCVVYEDIYVGVCSAKTGGFFVCGVYDEHSKHERELIEGVSDMFFIQFPK